MEEFSFPGRQPEKAINVVTSDEFASHLLPPSAKRWRDGVLVGLTSEGTLELGASGSIQHPRTTGPGSIGQDC
jgi:hypothetical protein